MVEETGQDVKDGGLRKDEFLQMQNFLLVMPLLEHQKDKSVKMVKIKESVLLYLEVLGTELMPIHINS